MKTRMTEQFGMQYPLFAFSRAPRVVVEASKAGAIGVLGATAFNQTQLEEVLTWIEGELNGLPYGIDVLMPNKYEKSQGPDAHELLGMIPEQTRAWVEGLLDQHGVPQLPEEQRGALQEGMIRELQMTPEQGEALVMMALSKFRPRLVVSALGTPPKHMIDAAHERGVLVGALVGSVKHARTQWELGVDILVAQGTEAGGHVGDISTMVLMPQVVDSVSPMPVLAEGGIANGRQMAAALALGAEGVWCGSVWLTTPEETEMPQSAKQKILGMTSSDAVITRSMTGKNMRGTRSAFTDAWAAPGAPRTLGMPLQSLMTREPMERVDRAGNQALITYPAGQVVGQLNEERSVREIIESMVAEAQDTLRRMGQLGEASTLPGEQRPEALPGSV